MTLLDGEYLITYSAYSRNGVRIALAKTKDFRQVERISLITQADYRNVVIFPEKFDGLYARLDRPHSEIAPWSIWISYSPDLRFWGESQLIMRPEPYHWDEMKIGPGRAADQNGPGMAFHLSRRVPDDGRIGLSSGGRASRSAESRRRSSAWATPGSCSRKIRGRSPAMSTTSCSPAAPLPEPDGTVKIYWGGADTVMCVGEANVADLVALCLDHGRPAK